MPEIDGKLLRKKRNFHISITALTGLENRAFSWQNDAAPARTAGQSIANVSAPAEIKLRQPNRKHFHARRMANKRRNKQRDDA